MTKKIGIFVVMLLLPCSYIAPQERKSGKDSQSHPTLRVPVNVMTIHATVNDKQGNAVTELKQSDFKIYEDGSIAGRFSETLHPKFEKDKQDIRKMNLLYRNYFKLQPGKYRLKIAVADESNNLGSTEQIFEVPEKPKEGLAVSNLILTAQKSALPNLVQDIQAQMMDDRDALLFRGMQITPRVKHLWPTGVSIPVLLRIYNINGSSSQMKLQAQAKLLSEEVEYVQPPVNLSDTKLEVISNNEVAAGFDLFFPEAKPGKYTLIITTSENQLAKTATVQTDLELVAR
jgi:hypothetical protein